MCRAIRMRSSSQPICGPAQAVASRWPRGCTRRFAATSASPQPTTIGLGLLFDTLVVRAFMTPSIAALLGRWFWWPHTVRPRPASQLLRTYGPRPLVRSLLLKAEHRDDDENTTELPKPVV